MKTFVAAVVSIFAVITFSNSVNGVEPNPGVACTLDLKYCPKGQYLDNGMSGCPECLQCPQITFTRCSNGETPVENPHVVNECPTWHCPNAFCTLELKLCADGQYLGTGSSGCPECFQCPLKKIGCPNGVSPIRNPRVENKCPTWYCPQAAVCTKEMKICREGQYLGTGSSGCPECLPCGRIPIPRCPAGVAPKKNPRVQNQCPSWYCPRSPAVNTKCL